MRTLKSSFSKMKAICIAIGLVTVFSASAEVPAFDSDKPTPTFTPTYAQVFNTWDGTVFYNQWDAEGANSFTATDITSGYLQFVWTTKIIIRSKSTYSTPYVFSAVLDWSAGPSTNGGIVVRAKATGNIGALQEPAISDPGFNREGIVFYPTSDGQNMIVQFSGVDNGYGATTVTKINVPKPAGVTSLLNDQGTVRIEDFGTSLYVYYNGARYIRIDLGGLTGGVYTSGTVYNSDMTSVGTFTGMEVETAGKVAIAQRNSNLRLYSAEIQTEVTPQLSFDSDKPVPNFNTHYNQSFNTSWDGTTFYNQWDMVFTPFDATDIAAGYLQFVWDAKRIIRSKSAFYSNYIIQTDIDYSTGSNRGGVVVRAKALGGLDALQEPAISDPGFNREGIAFYPSEDGQNMIVQFSGVDMGIAMIAVTRILVPKPASVASLLGRAIMRIEDFGTSIYVYYNESPFIRIDLGGKTGNIYTTGTVYDATMQVKGTFTGMEVEVYGKVAIAQRNATLRLYSVQLNYNYTTLISQTINFDKIAKKYITDAPFAIQATTTSGLPIEYKLVSGPATLTGNTLTLTGEMGVINVSANQNGNSIYYPATEVQQSIYVTDQTLPNLTIDNQDYIDNWVATDALGRTLPTYAEAGAKKTNKVVGVFYYTWLGAHGDKVWSIPDILKQYPSDPLSPSNPGWGGYGEFHFWGEPEHGYYRSEDPWVIRRDLQMLSNAKVDFLYIDMTNGYPYIETVKTLCKVSLQMRKEGIYTPQIMFFSYANSGRVMNDLYDQFYSNSLYEDLWFKWDGKPAILGVSTDTVLRPEVKNYFNIKLSWAWTNTKTEANHWQWIDTTPQDYGWSINSATPEQICVSVASHPNSSIGKSYSNGKQPTVNSDYLTDFTGQGLHFAEQWKRALTVDPPVIMVTQWNEWVAQRFTQQENGIYAGRPSVKGNTHFVDVFTEEFNRDMAPMKGGHTDNYYYQLISNIRKYKGMVAPQVFSAPSTINLDGNFADWSTINPLFKDPKGDVMHRNFKSYDPKVQLINTTGRNDIIESRATYDVNNIYFYVKTVDAITSYTYPNWMLLFIDADRNKGTGWEGYDYVVNLGVKSATETTLKKWDGTTWSNEVKVPYKLTGNEMEMSIPRTVVMMDQSTPEFYFHWSDNAQQLNDVTAFFVDGESAPDRRFNYNFSTSKIEVIPQTAYKSHTIPGTIEFEDFDNGGAGVAYADGTFGNSGGEYRTAESVDIEAIAGGGYNVGWINSNEWLSYTVDIKAMGKFTAKIQYASNGTGNEAILYVDGIDKSGVITFPGSGGLTTWISKSVDISITPGKHIIKFLIKNAPNDFKLDKIEFVEKDVVYPGNGTGLSKSIWTAALGGRTWFKDSICSEIDPVINHTWTDVSPGCNVSNDFWNIRWLGQIQPLFAEDYTFYLTVNDMGRVWINNQLLIDGWLGTSSGTTITGTVALTAGQKVPIKVDFAEKTGDAKIKLEWSSPSNPREVVPQSQLFPMGTTGMSDTRQAYFNVYPNPATNNLTITSGENQVAGIKIIDLQGRVVFTNSEQFSGQKSIKIDLEKGIYFIKLTGDIPFAAQKFIVE